MKNHSVKRGVAFAFATTLLGHLFVTLLLLLLALILVSPSANAQNTRRYNPNTILSGLALTSGQTTNLATPLWVDASGSQQMCFASEATAASYLTNNTIYYLAPSHDGIGMDTNDPLLIYDSKTFQLAAGNYGWTYTNLSVGAVDGYYIYEITGATVTGGTTNTFKASNKLSAP
jgi:hypothetical protein